MDLKDFIKETISGIVTATVELQNELEGKGVIVNPPASLAERDLFEEGSSGHVYRRVETVEFDVAVTAASETAAGGRLGLKILSIEAGADGKHQKTSEEVSRVKFAIPIALAPSKFEAINREIGQERVRQAQASFKPRTGIV